MRKAIDEWMPLNVLDYMLDTQQLTAEQSGAYLHLLMHGWIIGFLPDDDEALAGICMMSRRRFARHIGPAIRPYFTVTDGGRLVQKRQEIERRMVRCRGYHTYEYKAELSIYAAALEASLTDSFATSCAQCDQSKGAGTVQEWKATT